VRPAPQQQTTIHTKINMDGHEMGSAVTRHIGKWANHPQTGSSSHDGRMSMVNPIAVGS